MQLPVTILRPEGLRADLSEVMRILGYKAGTTRLEPRHVALVEAGIRLAEANAAPVVSLAYTDVRVSPDVVEAARVDLTWHSRSLARLLKEAAGVTLIAATLGPGIEQETERLFKAGDYALATAVDAAGSVLVHALCGKAQAYLCEQLQGLALTPIFGPGYGDWEIEDQRRLTQAAGGPAIGLTCTEACYLSPQKSLAGITGWLKPGAGQSWAEACTLCTKPDCAYRAVPARAR
ncbi:MAG TPA: hypothetical protein VGK74_16435 [Symbiobacteriaceae bacterium]|jgi:hypothetical protein